MIDLRDEAWLPRDVTMRDGSLYDEVMRQSYPVNDAAVAILALVAERRRIGAVARALAVANGLQSDVVAHDLISFVRRLNGAHLLNVGPRGLRGRLGMASYVALHLLFSRSFPPVFVTRHAISNSGLTPLLFTLIAVLVRHVFPVWIVPASILLMLGLAFSVPFLLLLFPAIATVFGCMVIHEIGHAVAIYASRGRSYLITAGWQVGIVHSIAEPSVLVHAGGGLLAGAAGALMVIIGHFMGSAVLVAVAFPFLLNLGGLTVATRDGRSLAMALQTGG